MSHIFGLSFFLKLAKICVFRALDWLSSISGSRIMAQKPCFWQIEKFHKRYNLPFQAKFWPAITWQQIELESYSNPMKTHEDLYLKMNKKILRFGLGIFLWWRHEWGMIHLYYCDVIANPMNQYCGSKFYWILG